jgi:integrase
LLHAMFQRAIDKRWWKGENPAHGVDRFKETSRDRFLRADEMPKFFEALAQDPNVDVRDYFLLSLLTGARRSKALAMRWQDINLDRAEWRIPQEANEKNVAMVPLMPEAVAILKARKQDAENDAVFVFPGTGKSGHLVEPKKGWQRVLERAGLSDLRIHDLRRTLGSWQARSGASLAIIGKSLGHKSQQATAIYARLDLDPVRASVEKATAAMLEAAGLRESADVKLIKRKSAAK